MCRKTKRSVLFFVAFGPSEVTSQQASLALPSACHAHSPLHHPGHISAEEDSQKSCTRVASCVWRMPGQSVTVASVFLKDPWGKTRPLASPSKFVEMFFSKAEYENDNCPPKLNRPCMYMGVSSSLTSKSQARLQISVKTKVDKRQVG